MGARHSPCMRLALCLLGLHASAAQPDVAQLVLEAKQLARAGDASGALAHLEAAEALASTAEIATLKGNVYTYLMRESAAGEAAYRRALEIEPKAWDAAFFLAKVISTQGPARAEEAALAFDVAAALKPSNLATRLEQGAGWEAAGSFQRASEAYLAAVSSDPHAQQALLARARAATRLGEAPEVVLAAWRDASETHPWMAVTLLEHASVMASLVGTPTADQGGVPSTSPTTCELLDAALLLNPGASIPPKLRMACDAERKSSYAAQKPNKKEAAAIAALKGGPCASLSLCAPPLAPFAIGSGGEDKYGRPRADRGVCTVQAPAGLEVRFSCGAHGLHVPKGLSVVISAQDDPAVAATGGLQGRLTLDAAGLSRHFLLEGSLSLTRVHLMGGRTVLSSGGSVLLLPRSSMHAADSVFERNRAAFGSGGAIAALDGARVSLRRTEFRRNSASWRGGALSMQRTGADERDVVGASELSLRDGGGVGSTGGGDGDESGRHVAQAEGGAMVWESNAAGFGGADVHICPASLLSTVPEGVRLAACSELGSSGMARVAAPAVSGPGRLESLECQAAAGELQEIGEVDATVAVSLLERATRSDPDCPTALMSYISLLYSSGMDAAAAEALAFFEARHPDNPTASGARAVLSNTSAPALQMRGQRLTKHVAAMREGMPSAARHATRLECQDAANDAFLRALALAPSDGDTWYDLGTSLFFAGELAESELCYTEGLRRSPRNAKLLHEADTWRTFAPSSTEAAVDKAGRASFSDEDFERVVLPEGSYSDSPASSDIHMGEDVFGATPSAWISRKPLLSRKECADAIQTAEAWAERNGGWTTDRHYSVPTTDVPLAKLPHLLPWFNTALATKLFPALLSRYPNATDHPNKLRVLDAFLVRYSAGAQAELPTHADQGQLSFTIMLNDPDEYEGGGTWFPKLERSLDGSAAGHIVLFPSKVQHGGRMITKGVRYIIVLFCGTDTNRSGRPAGYVLSELQRHQQRLQAPQTVALAKDEL